MKRSPFAIVTAIAVFSLVPSAYANQENNSPATANSDRDSRLTTQPATISNQWNNISTPDNNLEQVAESIKLIREQGCKNVDPLEFIKNPGPVLEKCRQQQTNTPVTQQTDTIEYFKVPRLDSGVRLEVTQF